MKRFAKGIMLLALGALFILATMLMLVGQKPARAQPQSAPASADQPSTAQRLMGDFAPKLADLTDQVLFGDVWGRPGLWRDRSLITVSAFIALNRPDQLRSHLARVRDNGGTQEEIVEVVAVAKGVFQNK